ncbi:MAG: TetR/AcrR family transcriptional regulator [Alphaproteobacteria bacterium]|nr:TetR/AcrR family transcriptional regulator [Alphaproteobacteria bacterium]
MTAAYHHGDLRHMLLYAATQQLERSGPAGLSLRAIAREVGVSPAAPYAHFPDKESLLAAIATGGFSLLRDACVSAAESSGGDPKALGRAYIGFALAHPHLYRLMFGGSIENFAGHPELDGASQAAFGFLRLNLAGAPDAASAAWAFVHGLAMLLIDRRLRPDDGDIHRLIDRLLQRFDPGRRRTPDSASLGL